jgi:hypothetical protein
MNRLAVKISLPIVVQQICNSIIDSEGTCTCGRVMRRLDAKLVMMTAVPSQGQMVAAAYCLPCSTVINNALRGLRNVTYTGVETAPLEKIKTVH